MGEPSASLAYLPGGMNRAAIHTSRVTITRVVTALGNMNFRFRGFDCAVGLAVSSDMIPPQRIAWGGLRDCLENCIALSDAKVKKSYADAAMPPDVRKALWPSGRCV